MMKTYQHDNESWLKIAQQLPKAYQLKDNYLPQEEFWQWHENQIHLDTYRNTKAVAKIILLHGVGTNGRQMTTILGQQLALAGYEIIAIDMPLYGMSVVQQKAPITYKDWVQLGSDYIDFEKSKDLRPIFLYGLSAGGMETYHVAAKNKKVAGIIGMTFLDQRSKKVRMRTTRNAFWGYAGVPLAQLAVKMGLGSLKMKMATCSLMSALCNNDIAQEAFLKDRTSAGAKVPFAFLASYMTYIPEVEPEEFDVCPILLTQPGLDRWTPLELSTPFLSKIKHVPVKTVILPNGGHYPVEKEALKVLNEEALSFIKENK